LRLEENLIKKAKRYAARQELSLSKMVEDYFRQLTLKKSPDSSSKVQIEPGPITRSLAGSLKGIALTGSEYGRYLDKKYQ
ncbi:MAG: antitoxin, partial [Deltaproteobacteria bacterium]|nr:antitoxin [Deltaproteobacteria bacterium]